MSYQHFQAAVYARVYEVQQMADLDWLKQHFEGMARHIKISKIYLETHRDMVVADPAVLRQAQQFFEARGVTVSGGITVTVNERNRFQTYCYTNPEHRQKLKDVVAMTAGLFDEVILDDFFFTNCKCPTCIQAKGEQSWSQFRLGLMTEAAKELVIAPARAANPQARLVIKYPNWYEHFQGLGFNLESEPPIFDGLYTGTETRDAHRGHQHLQPYHGYSIFRYFEALKPGANLGGWVDTGGMTSLDRYAEQLWLTLFAKAPEITLFDFRQLQRPIFAADRAPWQDAAQIEQIDPERPSFDFDQMIAPVRDQNGAWPADTTIALAAGYALEQVDRCLGILGRPIGLAAYKPFHSKGEDFLHSYLGMIGLPIALQPEFPAAPQTVLLTEAAASDPHIVARLRQHLTLGGQAIITSGLLRKLQDRGLKSIVELEMTERKLAISELQVGWFQVYSLPEPVLLPALSYYTNDSWEEIMGLSGMSGCPLLHSASYASGVLHVLVIPDNFADLYRLPTGALTRIRELLSGDLPVTLDAPSQVSLLLYDNHTLVVESFRDEGVAFGLILDKDYTLTNALTGAALPSQPVLDWRGQPSSKVRFSVMLAPHSYGVFQYTQINQSAVHQNRSDEFAAASGRKS